jgi:hypothetical protein
MNRGLAWEGQRHGPAPVPHRYHKKFQNVTAEAQHPSLGEHIRQAEDRLDETILTTRPRDSDFAIEVTDRIINFL